MRIVQALLSLVPNAKFGIEDNDYTKIQWLDERPLPSEEDVMKEVARLRAEWEQTEYRRSRQPEYPPIGDQLDDLFHAGAFSPEMTAKIQAIKDKYPKGS